MSIQVVVDGVVVYNQSDRLGQIVQRLERYEAHLAAIESLARANDTAKVLEAISKMRDKLLSEVDDLKSETAALLQSISDEIAAIESKLNAPSADISAVTQQLHDARMTIEAETAKLQGASASPEATQPQQSRRSH